MIAFEAGDWLAFGSTTGGMRISEGDSWICVTHTLPPVYVRIG